MRRSSILFSTLNVNTHFVQDDSYVTSVISVVIKGCTYVGAVVICEDADPFPRFAEIKHIILFNDRAFLF